ncbi:MAG: hypothetical protein WCJ61_02400, partial [Paludibacter sp.]
NAVNRLDVTLNDFETGSPAVTVKDGATSSVVANPNSTGNTSANCLKVGRSSVTNWWAPVIFSVPSFTVPANTIQFIHVLVNYPGIIPALSIQLNGSGQIDQSNVYQTKNTWQDVVFKVDGGVSGIMVTSLQIMIDRAIGLTTSTYGYIDNVILSANSSFLTANNLYDFEAGTSGNIYGITTYSSANDVITYPVANPYTSGINTTANCGKRTANASSQWWSGFDFTFTNPVLIDATHKYLHIMVTVPVANKKITISVRQDATNIVNQTQPTIIDANTWQDVVIDVSGFGYISGMQLCLGASGATSVGDYYFDQYYIDGNSAPRTSTPTLTFTTPTSVSKNFGDGTFTNAATSNSTGAKTYSSGNTSVATVNSSSGLVTIVSAGSSVITVSIAANGSYTSKTATYTLTVNKILPNLTFATPTSVSKNYGDDTFTNAASSSNSTGAKTYTSGTTGVATIDAATGLVTIVSAGSSIITATIAANGNYTSGMATYTLNVAKANQIITLDALTKSMGDADFSPATSASYATNVITYTSSNETVATIVSGLIHIISGGTTTITASQASSTNYNAATDVPVVLTVQYVIAATPNNAVGTVSAGVGNYNKDESVSLTATPASESYRFIKWTESGTLVSTANPYTFSATTNRTFVAHFAAIATTNVETELINSTDVTDNSDVAIKTGGILTVDGPKEVFTLSIDPNAKIDLNAKLTVVGDVEFKADNTKTFTAKISTGMSVSGAVRYVKTMDNSRWYFMAFPCSITLADIIAANPTLGAYDTNWVLKSYDGNARTLNLGSSTNWVTFASNATIAANQGFIFGLKNVLVGNFDVVFPLNKVIVETPEANNSVQVMAYGNALAIGANHKGWNLVGQPYLSKFASIGTNLRLMTTWDGVHNTYISWDSRFSLPTLNPFEAYFVQANLALEASDIQFNKDNRQLTPAVVANNLSDLVQLNISTPTGIDNTNLIMDNNQRVAYEIGQDLEKWITTGSAKPQIYTMLEGINYAFNALPITTVVNLPVGFYSQAAGISTFGISNPLHAPSLSKLILTDKTTNISTDLLTSNYTFTADAGTTTTRFMITAQRIATDDNKIENGEGKPTISILNRKLVLGNIAINTGIRVYDAIGRTVATKTAKSNSVEINVHANGIYSIQLTTGAKCLIVKVVAK